MAVTTAPPGGAVSAGRAITAPPGEPISPRRAYVEVLLVFLGFFGAGVMAAIFYLAVPNSTQGNVGWSGFLPAAFDLLAQAGVAVALVLLLLQRRGLTRQDIGLSLTLPNGSKRRWGPTIRVIALAELSLIIGSLITSGFGGKYPGVLKSADYLVYAGVASLNAGVVEELVVLAFVVTTLRQARRPWWEVVAVALVLRVSYHLYYGGGALGILVWAATFVWLYTRTKNLPALMLVHFLWDLGAFLGNRWPGVEVAQFGLIAVVLLVAPITWLVEYMDRRRPPQVVRAVPPPPGWGQPWAVPPPPPPWTTGPPNGRANGAGAGPAPAIWAPAIWAPAIWAPAAVNGGGPSGQTAVWPPGHGGPAPPPPAPLPPAWYADPSGLHRWRWWSGYAWTEHVSDGAG